MPTPDSAESFKRPALKTGGLVPSDQDPLPCPRCDSPNTKFCYYNNYNLAQPRHFCKSCRRYWTKGGTLRDIPVGGGTRKSAKRSRTINLPTSTSSSTATGEMNYEAQSMRLPATSVLVPLIGDQYCDVKGTGSFASLLGGNAAHAQSSGFLALGGFGLGIGYGPEDLSFGIGKGMWPFGGVAADGGCAAANGGGGGGGNGVVNGNGVTWQYENGAESAYGGGGGGGDCCFTWPDLAISTPGNGLK